jgi:hypothetical protein
MRNPRRKRACREFRYEIPELASGALERTNPDRARVIREHVETCERCEFEVWVHVRVAAVAEERHERGELTDSADGPDIREIVLRKQARERRRVFRKRVLGVVLLGISVAVVVVFRLL